MGTAHQPFIIPNSMPHLQSTLTHFIELSGDRTGERGESIDAGLAWIDRQTLVLLADSGETQNHNAGSWRRASRIIALARQLGKPLLLWNLSFHKTSGPTSNFGTEGALRDCQRDIIQFPAPIVSVIEATQFGAFSPVELAVTDGTVFVDGAEALCEYLSISPRTTHVGGDAEIAVGISHLLTEIASIPAGELVTQRTTRLAAIVMS